MNVNGSDRSEGQPLLTGDADEELRQQDRLIEQKDNTIDGKAKRVDLSALKPTEESKDSLLIKPPEKRRNSSKINIASPSHAKFDPKVKK